MLELELEEEVEPTVFRGLLRRSVGVAAGGGGLFGGQRRLQLCTSTNLNVGVMVGVLVRWG